MNKSLLIIIWSILMQHELSAQSKWVFENYNYWGQPGTTSVVPIIRFEAKNNWHAELRYNYEELQTLSVFGGRTFNAGDQLHIGITPLAGFSAGKFTGISAGVNTDIKWKKMYLSAETQYSAAIKNKEHNFLFTWSELGYNVTSHFFAGVSYQYTGITQTTESNPGLFAGLNWKGFSIPFYVFNPFATGKYFVLGVNYECYLKKKARG